MTTEIRQKIYSNSNLSPSEINRLFQSPVTPEFNLTIYRALQRRVIDPDVTLLQIIPRARSKEYLISIALCLRSGADSNMYVAAPKLGTVHILGYIYNILGSNTDKNILNTIILMLIAKGSRSSLPMFDIQAGKIRDASTTSNGGPSVIEWLNQQDYSTILDKVTLGNVSELHRIVNEESLTVLSILLDMVKLMKRSYQSKDMLLSIRSFSQSSFDSISTLDYNALDSAVTYLNSDAYSKILKRGQLPSYLLINKILLDMKSYTEKGHTIAVQELAQMLISSVAIGVTLDQEQLNLVNKDLLSDINREYAQPYWKKVCKLDSNTPEALRRLALSLNIDPNMGHTAICESINALSKSNKEELKEAARKRQQLRMVSNLGSTNEFIGGKTPILTCRNKSLLPNNPLDYNDIDIAYYRDDQGAIWCFTRDTFSTMLKTGVNPYNSALLSSSFKEELQHRIDILKKLGIDITTQPDTFSSTVNSLSSKDVTMDNTSERTLSHS